MGKDLTLQEAAQELGVTQRRVLYLIRRGRLPATKFGWQWSIKRSDLEGLKTG